MRLAVTGHRPHKLGGYGGEVRMRLRQLGIAELTRLAPSEVITGMALGWDTAIAEAAGILGIPFIAHVPFKGQESRWPPESRQRYETLLSHASEVVIVSEGGYSAAKMYARNESMVDAADQLLALWDGTPGGTANCVEYARNVGKPIIKCWAIWALAAKEVQ